jgi:ABC-type sugar transport system substrate-binding protein
VAARGVSALIVEPNDSSEVAEALNDARAAGTYVVLLERAVTSRDPTKPLARVHFSPLDEPFRLLVAAARKEVQASSLPDDGTVILLVHARPGPGAGEVIAAMRKALAGAGLKPAEEINYDGTTESGKSVLLSRIEPDPKVTLVLAHENYGLESAIQTLSSLKTKRSLIIAGCLSIDRVFTNLVDMVSAVVDRNQSRLARQALRTAASLARGENTPTEVEIPLEFRSRVTVE